MDHTRTALKPPVSPVDVNDQDYLGVCWICGDLDDHDGLPHAEATGDGLTRYDIIDYLDQVRDGE